MGEVNVTENDILLKKVRLLNACKTEAQWRQLDPVLLPGEVAFTIAKKDENDILNSAVLGYKVGNGTSKWSELDYPSGDWNINAKSAETAKEAETAKTAANATVADTALKWTYDTKVYVSLGTKSTDTRINARSSEDDDKAFSIGVDGVLGIENGGTGQSSFTKNTVLIINNDNKMQGTNFLDVSKGGTGKQSFTENYLIVGNGNNALKEIEILGVGHGGTGKKTLKEGFVLIGNGSSEINEVATYSEDVPKGELTGDQAKYIVTLGALKKYSGTSSISTVGTITNGTWKGSSIGANYGGTGLTKDEIGKANAVVITGGGDTNKLKIAESKAGAFYSTGNNSLPQFGTLKVAYGGTGSTTFTQNVPIFYNGTALESRNYFKSTIWSDGAEKVSGKNVYYITDGYGVAYFKRIGLGIVPDSNYVLKTSGAIYISGNTTHSGDITFSALGSIGESNKITWNGGTDGADIYYKLEANDQGALIFNMRDDYNTHFRWAYNKSDLISMDMYSNFYPNTDLSGSLGTSMNRWGSIYAGILRLQGPSSNPSASAGARIEFTYDDNTSRLQPVYISYTPNDSYRQPAGLKIFGGTDATPAWLEVEGDIYANKSIRNLEVGGGIYWNPYVESAADASDAASITVLNGGCAGGTELRISQQNDWNDVINLVTNSYIYLNGKRAFQINDSWLRINQDVGFSSGIYTGSSLVRSDYQFQVGDNGNKFYANNSGNGYFSNTLGIGGTNTGYRLYVNGTSYFTSNICLDGPIYQNGGYNCSGNGQYSYYKICTINISSAYINRPVVLEISGRGRHFSTLEIIFQNTNVTDPALSSFITDWDNCYYIIKTATSTWEVYGVYSEGWGYAVVHRVTGAGSNIGVTINMTNVSNLPSGCIQVSYGYDGRYVNVTGDTMTGPLGLVGNRYGGPSGEYGMNCNNSDIVGINGLFTDDNAENFAEGLNFYRSASTWDAMAASNGTFYFGSNVGFGAGLTGSANIVAGAATFNGHVLANRNTNTMASFVWNKSGTNWGGIGYNGQTNENYFGPCDSNGVWTNTDTDCWTFRNRIKIVGAASNNMAYNTGNPRLIFAENANTQQVGIVYTDYDSYRPSKGLRIMDVNNDDTGNVWLEVQGNVYAPTFVGNLNGNAAAAHRLIDQGTITAINGTSRYTSGLRIGNIYNSGYPFSYGVTLTMEARSFGAELIFNGLGGGGATGSGDMRFRTHSDWSTSEWGGWRTVLDTANYAGILDERYINVSGDTMTGHLNATAGLTWNHVSWNPNGNIYCQPTDNYQEWSIDVGSASYTGSYFHVWSARNSVSMLRCFSDDNSVDIPSGAFTVSGGNAYFTKTIICSSQIGNYGEGIRLNCNDGQWATITMGSTGDTGTRDNCWSIHRKSDNNFCISRNSSDGVNGLVMTATGMGLGTTSPGYRLHVNGTSYLNGDLTIPNNHAYYGILGSNSSTTSSNTGGLTWFDLNGTAGAQVNVNDTPTSAWWYILRNRHTNTGNNYYTDIAIPFNDTSIYYKTIRNGSVVNDSWVKVLDSNNYSSYVFLPWALFEIRQAQSSGSSIYIWWGTNNDFSPKDGNTPSGSSNFSLNTGNRSFINCPRSGYVRITVNLAVKASTEVSSCYLDINEYYDGREHWKDRRIGLGNIKTNYTIVNGSTIVYVRKGACLQFKLGSINTLYEDYLTPYWPHIILEYIT